MVAGGELRPLHWRDLALVAVGLLLACSPAASQEGGPLQTTSWQQADPKVCADCHPRHYRDWSGSMHAYASEDPVFRAMNARGQRETDGALGDFCIRCHAPMAVALGRSSDGLNLDSLPAALQGVGCNYCHSVVDAGPEGHNNPLNVALDEGILGPFTDPAQNEFHRSGHSPWLDGRDQRSSRMCGSCHDVVVPSGLHLERTYAEWQGGAHAAAGVGCHSCHMPAAPGFVSAGREGPRRLIHNHSMPAIDVALTPFPQKKEQRSAIEAMLADTLRARLCVDRTAEASQVQVTLRNQNAGHAFPSGSAQDRRVTVELTAELASGKKWQDASWVLGNTIFDHEQKPVHMFWQAASMTENLLPAAQGFSEQSEAFQATAQTRKYTLPAQVTGVRLRIRLRPLHTEFLEDLISTGDLDEDIAKQVPEFELTNAALDWQPGAEACVASSL